jgi:hypothetical protein
LQEQFNQSLVVDVTGHDGQLLQDTLEIEFVETYDVNAPYIKLLAFIEGDI